MVVVDGMEPGAVGDMVDHLWEKRWDDIFLQEWAYTEKTLTVLPVQDTSFSWVLVKTKGEALAS